MERAERMGSRRPAWRKGHELSLGRWVSREGKAWGKVGARFPGDYLEVWIMGSTGAKNLIAQRGNG